MELPDFSAWVGRTETSTDEASAAPLRGLAALLDHVTLPMETLPPLGHWLYFLPTAPQAEIGDDGHPRKGGFLPPIPLPRRMWAGGRLQFHHPIRLGAALERVTRIEAVTAKQGRDGPLCFVTLIHRIHADGTLAVTEEQDIVYRQAAIPDARPTPVRRSPAEMTAHVTSRIQIDPVRLFRFSALTFNGHRIHYDRDYARRVEAYPGLVVHGPYQAMLLMDHFRRRDPAAQVVGFSFRGKTPLFDGEPIDLCLTRLPKGAALWTADANGGVGMQAELEVG